MPWLELERVPEPESMDDPDEVASYASAAAARHLEAIDDTLVDHLAHLLPSDVTGGREYWGIDIGAGPAQIPIKILKRYPSLKIVAADRSSAMLASAIENARSAGVPECLLPLRADVHQLPFPDGSFSVVMCNSVLHHARTPVQLLREMFRLAGPNGAVLLRDLRRPSRPLLRWHLWRHGHHYSGKMRELFEASVRASYTLKELSAILHDASGGDSQRASVFSAGTAHIGVHRRAR